MRSPQHQTAEMRKDVRGFGFALAPTRSAALFMAGLGTSLKFSAAQRFRQLSEALDTCLIS
jgi:hypothetical protein